MDLFSSASWYGLAALHNAGVCTAAPELLALLVGALRLDPWGVSAQYAHCNMYSSENSWGTELPAHNAGRGGLLTSDPACRALCPLHWAQALGLVHEVCFQALLCMPALNCDTPDCCVCVGCSTSAAVAMKQHTAVHVAMG
jgi:hypothetical protein